MAGIAAGLLVASGSTLFLLASSSEDTARELLSSGTVYLDWRVLLVTTTVTFVAGLVFGLYRHSRCHAWLLEDSARG